MIAEPEESFERLSNVRFLSSDESVDLAMILTTEKGSELRCSFSPKQASDLVASLLYSSRERFEAQGGNRNAPEEIPLIPLPVHQLEVEEGRHSREVVVRLSVGQIRLLFAMDVDALVGLCKWLSDQIQKDEDAASSLH